MEPVFNFDVSAPLAALALFGTVGTALAGAVTSAWLGLRGNGYAARWVAASSVALPAAYAVALAGLAAVSGERVVPPVAARYFCEPGPAPRASGLPAGGEEAVR